MMIWRKNSKDSIFFPTVWQYFGAYHDANCSTTTKTLRTWELPSEEHPRLCPAEHGLQTRPTQSQYWQLLCTQKPAQEVHTSFITFVHKYDRMIDWQLSRLSLPSKSLYISRARGEVSLVEQDTIEKFSAAYLKFIIIFLRKNSIFFHLHFMHLFSADTTLFKTSLKRISTYKRD